MGVVGDISRLILPGGSRGGLELAVRKQFIPRETLTWPSMLTEGWKLGDKVELRDRLMNRHFNKARRMIVQQSEVNIPYGKVAREFMDKANIVHDSALRKKVFYETQGYRYDELSLVAQARFPKGLKRMPVNKIAEVMNTKYSTGKYKPDTIIEMEKLILKQAMAYVILPDPVKREPQ